MATQKATRRRFLVAAITYSGLISTGVGTSLLRASHAWAQSPSSNTDILARMARLLFPHDAIADDVYAEVMDDILAAAVADSSLSESLGDAVTALNAAQGGDWFDIGEEQQIAAMQAVEGEVFFAAILGNVQVRFYHHPQVWKHIGYPGSSLEFGGYVDRGFNDIDWLPEDA
jgi:hypothetical protein